MCDNIQSCKIRHGQSILATRAFRIRNFALTSDLPLVVMSRSKFSSSGRRTDEIALRNK